VKKVLFPIAVLLLAGAFVFLINKKNRVEVYTVEEKPIRRVVYASGYVKPIEYVIVKSEVSGYIREIRVKEGQRVKKGEVLAVLDLGSLQANLKEVEANLRLVKDRARENSDFLNALKKEMEIAQRNVEQAEKVYKRRERLSEQGLIPREQYEEAKRSYENAKSEYERALSNYKDTINSLKAEEKILLAQRERVMREMEKYYVRSPIDGVVLNKYVEVGDYINHLSQDNNLFSVGKSEEFEVVLEVDEEYASLIKEGMRVFLSLDAYSGKVFEGKVRLIKRELNKNKKTFEVRVFADLPKDTPANATVEANVLVEEKTALVIPVSAYKDGYVYKYEKVRKVKVPVKVGAEIDGYYEVLEGLKKGDKVVK